MRNRLLVLLLTVMAFATTGCVQEALVVPVATISGRVVVPAGEIPTGVRVTVAGESEKTYVNEEGEFTLEMKKSGKYLLIARGRNLDVNYVWVDAIIEETVEAPDINLDEKVVGEALWIATTIDFPEATKFEILSDSPQWNPQAELMYDDGSHGDKVADDGIYTLRLTNLQTGSQLYEIRKTYVDDNKEKISDKRDPHQEGERNYKSEIIIPESTLKLARGTITSDLTGVNYSEVVLSTKKGSRSINVDSDGGYNMSMEGNGKEYLVFRSPNFHIRAIPVDLTTVPVYDVPVTSLSAKKGGEVKLMFIKSDFASVTTPMAVADFTNWQPQQLYDDGTNGDEVAGDGVYTRMFTRVAPGYHKYAFNITETSQVKDPYQESGDSDYSIILVK